MVVKPPVARRGCAVDGRCCAQRAVHLGRMCRKRGVWGEVDDVVSVGSRCWGRVVGPRQRGRPGWRRRCEGWLGQGRIDAGCKKAGPRRVPPQCCRSQAADAPGSSLASRRPGPASRRSAPQSARPSHGLFTKNAQFFHQPLTVSTAWVPRSVSAEWALTRPEDRRAAWKREATFSQFTRFHQALT